MQLKRLFANIPYARYNVAAWQAPDNGNVFMLAREVEKPGEEGEPDIGRLVLVEFDELGEVLHEKVVWRPEGDSLWLEDPRALVLNDGSVLIGLTALLRERNGYKPYPSLTRLVTHTWREVLPAVTVIETFGPGKNLTPIDEYTFLCRPEQPGYFHKLLVFVFEDLLARKLQDLEFPTTYPWAKWRIGTTMPPIWITPEWGLMIFHGIRKEGGKYIYRLGRAGLHRRGNQFYLDPSSEPILTPDDFVDEHGQPLVEELHPHQRRVVYACGGVIKKAHQDKLSLYVNVGDTATFEVEFPLAELAKGLV